MSMALNRKTLTNLVLAMILAVLTLFSMPVVAQAESPNNPGDISVDVSGGNLSISGGNFDTDDQASAWNQFIEKYRNFIVGIAGIGAVTMIVLFIIQFLKLGASAGNPQARSQALVGVLWTGIAAAGLGAVTIIVGFFYNAFG